MINEEKKKALEAALGHIEKQYGKGTDVPDPVRQPLSETPMTRQWLHA